ncbi:hypothetical protein ACIA8O_11705 [Kitasatospora sp. NPDC051853]|uniref:hypothetical protein n=1 Tax=Kitasatospora sp. NPDC051853 TaxID=3364058 RepID=UPI0037A442FF
MNRVSWYHAELDDGAPLVLLTFPDESVLIGDPRTLPPNLLPVLAATLATGPLTPARLRALLADHLRADAPVAATSADTRPAPG